MGFCHAAGCRGPEQQNRGNIKYEQTLPMTRTFSGQGEGARGLPIDRKCPHPGKGLATDPSVSISNVILDICGSPKCMLSLYQKIHQKTQLSVSATI